ncbi:MAG: DUF488 domain-containing protein [Acidobacteria bacterium]|nr:DUF488 domain-containing protein [Acidobacteriota bacterium]
MGVKLKRVYDPPEPDDGVRILVDRLWPRGMTKEAAAVDEWLRDAAPSTTLRKWFAHDPRRWREFEKRYFRELNGKPEVVNRLRKLMAGRKLTLVYGARDPQMNNAVALRHYLEHLAPPEDR